MMVSPIHVDEVVRAVEIVLESGRFGREALDLGGPMRSRSASSSS